MLNIINREGDGCGGELSLVTPYAACSVRACKGWFLMAVSTTLENWFISRPTGMHIKIVLNFRTCSVLLQ